MDIRRKTFFGTSENYDYSVILNGQWRKSAINPETSVYNSYESFYSYHDSSSIDIMYIDIHDRDSFKLYIRSDSEKNDYVMVSQLDASISLSTVYTNETLVKSHTYNNPQSSTELNNYTLVEFGNIGGGDHRITIGYKKDGSYNYGNDQGYVLIPKYPEWWEKVGGDILSFTLGGLTYNYKRGMTWKDFINSYFRLQNEDSYNAWCNSGDDVMCTINSIGQGCVQYGGVNVLLTDEIIDGGSYTCQVDGGGFDWL